MSARSIGFLGGGRVVRIVVGGWAHSGNVPPEIVVSDPDERALVRLQESQPQVPLIPADQRKAAAQDVVFLAVHPPAIPAVMADVKAAIRPEAVLVSLAPKVTISRLSEMLGGFGRIARVIPNAPSIVCAGFNPVAFGEQLPAAERQLVVELLNRLGECPVVAENKLEAYAVITAMGPTYFWPQLYELQALAESFGLSAAEARQGIWQMICGALAAMFNSGLDRAGVEDLIPVKPLAEQVAAICEASRTILPGVMKKILP